MASEMTSSHPNPGGRPDMLPILTTASGSLQEPPSSAPFSRFCDVAWHIVDAMPRPDFSPFSDTAPCDSRRDLLSLLGTSTIFFHPAASALWECPIGLQALIKVLADSPGETDASMDSMSPQDMEQYVFGCAARLINASGGASHSGILGRFHFYASCIVRLRISSREAPTTLLAYLSSLLPTGTLLFSRLRELSWVEPQPCMSSMNITTLLSCSRTTVLTLRFKDQSLITLTRGGRDFFAASVVELLQDVSAIVPNLRELTVHAPSAIPIPVMAVLRFGSLHRANLHMSITGAVDFIPELQPMDVSSLEAFEVHWTSDTNLGAVASVLDLGQVRELSVTAYHHLGQGFLYNMHLLVSRAPSFLTHIEIVALGDMAPSVDGGRLVDVFRPLLARRSLQKVTMILTGYRLDFSPPDLSLLGRAWPDLRHLNLSFSLLDYNTLPNMGHFLPNMYELCPRLEFLHLPALATSTGHSAAFHLPILPDCAIEHISADVAWFEHKILDVAWSLRRAFPRLRQVGPVDGNDGWRDTNDLVRALQDKDYATIFEHVAKYLRAGMYRPLPYSLYLVVRMGLEGLVGR